MTLGDYVIVGMDPDFREILYHAGHAMDASVARAAPKVKNPVMADELNLAAGARLYREHCTLCHGDPAHPKAMLADSLNPPAPQFMKDMADMPENQGAETILAGLRKVRDRFVSPS